MTSNDLALRVQEASENAPGWFEIGRRLQEKAGPPDEDVIWPFVWAFQYDFVEVTEAERRRRWGPFAPWGEFEDGVIPQPLDSVPDQWLEEWLNIAAVAQSHLVRSRLFDLLWERRWGERPDLHGRAAVDAYVELAGGPWESLQQAEALARALEIARHIRDKERLAQVITLIVGAVRLSMAQDQPQPGVALRLIEAMMRLPRNEQPIVVDDLLDTAATIYKEDPWVFESVLDLQASRARDDIERVRSVRLQQVFRWREFAATTNGLLRLAHLQHSLELARIHGLADIANQLRSEIQSIKPDEIDLKEMAATVEIPRDKIEEHIEWFASGGDWSECLTRFGYYGPPSGDYAENLAVVIDQMQRFPLQYLFTKVVLSSDNVPIRIVASEDQHRAIALSEYESRSISMWGIFAVDILDRIRERHGTPGQQDLTEFFTTQIVQRDVADRLARSLLLYWEQQPDEASHILLPRLETVIRELCRQLGHAVIREPAGDKPGGVRTLGELLRALEGQMDESWRRYLWNLLSDPVGLNLRNRILHGLTPTVGPSETALLLHAACHLRTIQLVAVGEQNAG